MPEENNKRKTITSTEVKNRYLKKAYDQIIIRVPKDTAAAFKEKCKSDGISQAEILKNAIDEFLKK